MQHQQPLDWINYLPHFSFKKGKEGWAEWAERGTGTGIECTETGTIDADTGSTGSTGTGTGAGIQGLSSSWNNLQHLD